MSDLTPEEKRRIWEEAAREVDDLTPGSPPLSYRPPEGWVLITHPTSEGATATVTEEAYHEVWKKQGWRSV